MVEPAQVARHELVSYLDDLLDAHRTGDLAPNGLQVEGAATVRRIVTGVSACRELFRKARELQADTILVHHGIFWRSDPPVLTGFRRQRVAELIDGDLNLIAYHLPLDRHPGLGNNAVAAEKMGLLDVEPFGLYEGASIGVRGRLPEPLSSATFSELCAEVFGQQPQLFADTSTEVSTVGVISGAAQREFYRAIEAGLDAFVTGEASEWVVNVARESGVLYAAAGHYATETLGIQALGDHLADRFGLHVEFVDVPNPV